PRGRNHRQWTAYYDLLEQAAPHEARATIYGRVVQGLARLGTDAAPPGAQTIQITDYGPYDVSQRRVALQYWFQYHYDDWASRHEGDWESIALLLELARDVIGAGRALDAAELLAGTTVHAAGYSAHEDGTRRLWPDVQKTAEGPDCLRGARLVGVLFRVASKRLHDLGARWRGREAARRAGRADARAAYLRAALGWRVPGALHAARPGQHRLGCRRSAAARPRRRFARQRAGVPRPAGLPGREARACFRRGRGPRRANLSPRNGRLVLAGSRAGIRRPLGRALLPAGDKRPRRVAHGTARPAAAGDQPARAA